MNKKTIKINYCGFWNDFDIHYNLIDTILKERYNIEISDNPDFLFCSLLGKPHEYMKYDCVRIFFSGENLTPDFTLFDYALAFDYIDFGDRYLRYPLSIWRNSGECKFREALTEEKAVEVLKQKKFFCSFVYGHESNTKKRELLLDALNTYKKVESAGTFRNNQPNNNTVRGKEKFDFLLQSKFTICAESVEYPGFTTEKLSHGFDTFCIPIYHGDPLVGKVFNTKAFINCGDYNNFNEVVDRVREIDENDKLFIEMLCEPVTADVNFCHKKYEELKHFLYNICDQNPNDAYRRMRCFQSSRYELFAKEYSEWTQSLNYKIYKKIHK